MHFPTGVARHPRAARQWYRLLLFAAFGLRRMPTIHCQWGRLISFSLFLSMVTLTFDLWPQIRTRRDFCKMHLIAKFHRPTFNRSEVIVRTKKLTNWQTNWRRWKHPPRFATLRRCVKALHNPASTLDLLDLPLLLPASQGYAALATVEIEYRVRDSYTLVAEGVGWQITARVASWWSVWFGHVFPALRSVRCDRRRCHSGSRHATV